MALCEYCNYNEATTTVRHFVRNDDKPAVVCDACEALNCRDHLDMMDFEKAFEFYQSDPEALSAIIEHLRARDAAEQMVVNNV